MKIAMMVDTYKPHVSGITNAIALNKKLFEARGHEVFVFTFGDEDYVDDEPNVVRSPGIPLVDTGYYISLRYNKRARRLLYTMDIAHVHHPFLSGSLAVRYCRPRNIPIVFTNHTRYDLYAQAYFPLLPETISETALRAYLPTFCRSCDMVIAPSNGMRQILQKIGVDSAVTVIPNGVDLAPFQNSVEPVSREDFGIGAQDAVLMYVGRLGPEKNLPFLLRSFNGAAEAYGFIHLVIVGDGPERDNLEDRVNHMGMSGRIHFTGMVPYDQLRRYLAMADAFVTASVTEVHPLSIIEAMAAGLPVLGIDSPGVGDTIEDGITGYLTSEDLAAYTAKMIRLVTENDRRRQMGEEARRVSEQYSIERTTAITLEHYHHLVNHVKTRKRSLRTRLTILLDRWTK